MNDCEKNYIPAEDFFNYVMMFRPFYRKKEEWSCDDVIQLFQKTYKIDIKKEKWFCQDSVNYLFRGCHDWNKTQEKNYFSKYHKELNPFLIAKNDTEDWHTNICIPSEVGRLYIAALSDYAAKKLAQFIYPSFDEKFTPEMVPQALQQRRIDAEGSKIDYDRIFDTLNSAYHILNNPEAYIQKKAKENEEIEKKKQHEINLRKSKKKKLLTMLALTSVFYFISCILHDFDEVEGAVCRVLIWFLWAAIEIIILSAWDVKSIYTKITKTYSIFSFLSVPLIAFLFVFFLHAYNNRDFLHATMILFAPSGYILTWIIFLIHHNAITYINRGE